MTHIYKNAPTEILDTAVAYHKDGTPIIEEHRIEIHVREGADAHTCAALPKDGLVVGSGEEAGLRLNDPSVSRAHLRLMPSKDGVLVTDLGSTNGTMVNANRITDAVVAFGSVLHLGKTRIELLKQVASQSLPLSRRRKFGDLIGTSSRMRQVYSLLEVASEVDATVLIEGETGTGKDLAAQAVHQHSNRAGGPFVVVDCGAVSPTLIEAELFGHTRGSFTGADKDREGAFELADGGTLFFDEIGELPLSLQPKLLRAIESKQVRRVGGGALMNVDVRFVTATNRDLENEVKAGRFREDLYYRLNVFKIKMPPLRERINDIPLLVEHFLAPTSAHALSKEIVDQMLSMPWPGNVRELKNAVERAMIMARVTNGDVKDEALPITNEVSAEKKDHSSDVDISKSFKDGKSQIVSAYERAYIEQALKRSGGNVSAAARSAGIDRKHLERLIKKHDIR